VTSFGIMVKVDADAERDYYADLGLDPSADANEVKKAFKRLGMEILGAGGGHAT